MISQAIDHKNVEILPVVHLTRNEKTNIPKSVVREYTLTIIFNGRKMVELVSSQSDIDELAIGYLSAEGLLQKKIEIKNIQVDYETGIVILDTFTAKSIPPTIFEKRIIGSGYGRGAAYYDAIELEKHMDESNMKISVSEILDITDKFQHSSITYENTHGVHSAALCKGSEMPVFKEDIGRHNAIDKVLGHCIFHDLPTSGRICSEAIQKGARQGIPMIVSIASPTCRAIDVAKRMGNTLVASVKDGKMDVYTHDWRII
jgi:FdhD protein